MLNSTLISVRRMFFVAAICIAGIGARAQAQGFTLIVNVANPVASLSKDEVSSLFLKHTVKWSDGRSVAAVDQDKNSKTRDAFTKAVHGRSVGAVYSYWQQQVFGGKDVPPVEKPGDADVLAFVRSNANAIGYIASGTTLGENVKAVPIK
jgi:ABC-type phosphate transport system substrate-binding protein